MELSKIVWRRFFIDRIELNYTSDMEKAMHMSHGVGYEVYSRKHEVRMRVEKQRERNYAESKRVLAEITSKLYSITN
ncbi:hypothetical protein [Neobacillus kokaensis]|nr:hypothetical protein [Neobacillus kokaensis]